MPIEFCSEEGEVILGNLCFSSKCPLLETALVENRNIFFSMVHFTENVQGISQFSTILLGPPSSLWPRVFYPVCPHWVTALVKNIDMFFSRCHVFILLKVRLLLHFLLCVDLSDQRQSCRVFDFYCRDQKNCSKRALNCSPLRPRAGIWVQTKT